MTNHVKTVVYTTYMNRFYRLIATLLIITLSSSYSWGQDDADKAPSDADSKKPNDKTETIPIRPHSRNPRLTYPLNAKHNMEVLASKLSDKGATQWITSEEETFLAIWHADRSGNAKGAILIIHAEGEHPAWPQTTKPLHDSLPDYGWATMAVHLAPPAPVPRPKRELPPKTVQIVAAQDETAPENDAEPDTSKTPKADTQVPPQMASKELSSPEIEAATEQRLVAALKFLHDKGQFNIVIMGSGVGAIRTHRFIKSITPVVTNKRLRERLEKPIRASIIFNARNRLPTEDTYTDWFFDPEIPVLDIYTTHDLRNKKEAQARKILGKQKKAYKHSQFTITEITHEKFWRENQLSRRVRSFLDAYLQGIEINKKAAN